MAGVFVATFVLFPTLGLTWTNRVGALLDVAVGVIAIVWVSPRLGAAAATAAQRAPDSAAATATSAAASTARARATVPAWLLLAVYAVVGCTALLYEVAWMRGLATVLGSSIYAFSSMLGAFLTGIALGSLAFRRWIDRTRTPWTLLGAGIAALAVLGLGTTILVPHLPALLLWIIEWGGLDTRLLTATQVGICMLAMLPPTLVLGGLFPLVARCLAEQGRDAGDAVGRVYFANTVGSAMGAFVTGFVLLPWLGLRETLALGAALDLLAAALVLWRAGDTPAVRRWAAAPLAAALLLAVMPVPFDRVALTRGVFKAPEAELEWDIALEPIDGKVGEELLYYRDGINATVSVHREDGVVAMRVNGKVDASNVVDMSTQVLLGQVPLLFGPPPKKALVIGYASGVTVGSVATHPGVERVDAVEIEPAILEASSFFDRESGRPLDDPRVRLVLDDARSYLAATDEQYDVIISQPSNPWMTGVSNLFTRDFFAIARARLAPGGRLLQWMQLYALDPTSLATIVAALRAEFPYVYGFADLSGGPDVLFLAMDRPLTADDLPRWEDLPASVRGDLMRVGNFSTFDLWSLLRVTPDDVDAFAATAPVINTDDNLFIELSSPWMLYGDTFTANWKALVTTRGAAVPLFDAAGAPLDAEQLGELALAHARKRSDAVPELLRLAGERGGSGAARAASTLALRSFGDGSASLTKQLAELDEALRLSPGSFSVVLLRGEVRDEAGDRNGALADAERALELRPDDPRARALRMRVLAQLGRVAEARADADVLLATRWGQSDVAMRRDAAEILRVAGDIPRAIEVFESLLKGRDAAWSEGWPMLARAYAQRGDDAASRQAYANATASRRNEAKRLHRMALTALWRGRTDEARRMLKVAVAVDPEYKAARRELERLSG